MDRALLEDLYKQAEEIARETGTRLMKFSKQAAEILYSQNPVYIQPDKMEGEHGAQSSAIAEKFRMYQETVLQKAEYAPIEKHEEAEEIKKILAESNARIKKLYQDGLAFPKNT